MQTSPEEYYKGTQDDEDLYWGDYFPCTRWFSGSSSVQPGEGPVAVHLLLHNLHTINSTAGNFL
jgi:hypothetical protein